MSEVIMFVWLVGLLFTIGVVLPTAEGKKLIEKILFLIIIIVGWPVILGISVSSKFE